MTRMIRSGFLNTASRKELTALVRNAKAESRVTRRANGILLLDDGLSCAQVAKVLYMDDGYNPVATSKNIQIWNL
ncbi:MAG: hypothetical protein AAF228_07885 [Pseudomonadota bacterium]